jgi:hypothetical protein
MPDNPAKEAFEDLLTYLERLETQTGALLQFLRDNGTVTDEKLAPYLEQASKGSDVRMRAARVRIEHLFSAQDKAKSSTEVVPASSGEKSAEEKDKTQQKPATGLEEPKQADSKEEEKRRQEKQNSRTEEQPSPKDSSPKEKEKEPSEIVAGREAAKHAPSKEQEKKTEDRPGNPDRSDTSDKDKPKKEAA